MQQQVVVDGGLKVVDAGIASAPDAFGRDLGEEPFDQVEPRGAGRREVQFEARVFFQPRLDLRRLVRGLVVQDEAHLARRFHRPVDTAQKAKEFLGPVARHAVPDHHA